MARAVVAKPVCHYGTPVSPEFEDVRAAILAGISNASFEHSTASNTRRSLRSSSALTAQLARADCVIMDLSIPDVDVYYELGIAQAMAKPLFVIVRESLAAQIPTDMARNALLFYEPNPQGLARLTRSVARSLDIHRKAPQRARPTTNLGLSSPFFIDWARLDDSDADNLIRELLMQLGYSNIDWTTDYRTIDLIAEYPKKDPDGFEYRELWLALLGRRLPLDRLIGSGTLAAESLFHSLMTDIQRVVPSKPLDVSNRPITILIADLSHNVSTARFEDLQRRLQARWHSMLPHQGIRFRLWTRDYLSSLIRQFPQLGFKYFSDEGRAKAKYRKSPEELYTENVTLLAEREALLLRLNKEKVLRISAERDAAWKISHSLPLTSLAILSSLLKRM